MYTNHKTLTWIFRPLFHSLYSCISCLTEVQSDLLDVQEDNVHAILVDANGNLEQLGQTLGFQVRTDNSGVTEGRLWLDYNCDKDKRMKIYLANNFLDGETKPISPVLEFYLYLPNVFHNDQNFSPLPQTPYLRKMLM
jgi:hypothetical protein